MIDFNQILNAALQQVIAPMLARTDESLNKLWEERNALAQRLVDANKRIDDSNAAISQLHARVLDLEMRVDVHQKAPAFSGVLDVQEAHTTHLESLNRRIGSLEAAPLALAGKFDEMYNNVKANVLADLEDMIEAGASKVMVKHLELFNHDAYDEIVTTVEKMDSGGDTDYVFNVNVKRAIEAQPEIVQDLVSEQIDEAIEKHETNKHNDDDDDDENFRQKLRDAMDNMTINVRSVDID